MEHQVFQVCETRKRLPNYDDSIAAASVRTVATTETENSILLDDLFNDLESYKAIQDSIVRQYPGYNPDANFHALRHTFATLALQNGVDVKTVSSMLSHYDAHPPYLHPRYSATAEMGGGDDGQLYGAGHVEQKKQQKCQTGKQNFLLGSLPLSGHVSVWVRDKIGVTDQSKFDAL